MDYNETLIPSMKETQMFNNYVVKLTAENIPAIVAWAAERQWNLDHLEDSLECNAENGATTLLFLTMTDDDQTIVTFNDAPQYQPTVRFTNDKTFEFFTSFEKI